MNISNMERVTSKQEVKDWLIDELELTGYAKEKVLTRNGFLENSPFGSLYCFKATKPTSSIWWRLTSPFFVVFLGLVFASMPFNWTITGRSGYDANSKIYKLYSSWSAKL